MTGEVDMDVIEHITNNQKENTRKKIEECFYAIASVEGVDIYGRSLPIISRKIFHEHNTPFPTEIFDYYRDVFEHYHYVDDSRGIG